MFRVLAAHTQAMVVVMVGLATKHREFFKGDVVQAPQAVPEVTVVPVAQEVVIQKYNHIAHLLDYTLLYQIQELDQAVVVVRAPA
jgi:hypothetical protein